MERTTWLISQSFLFLIIGVEFYAYVLTRQVVNVFEWLVAWRGEQRHLRRELRKAKNYDEWVRIAKQLDACLGFDDWKENEDDGYFDYLLVRGIVSDTSGWSTRLDIEASSSTDLARSSASNAPLPA